MERRIQYYRKEHWWERKHIHMEWFEENGVMEGMKTTYYPNGSVMVQCPMKAGARNGAERRYTMTGEIEAIIAYKDGAKNGLAQYFRADGSLEAEEEYKDNMLDGKVVTYSKEGLVSSECFYKASKKEGLCSEFDRSGRLTSQIMYHNNRRNGVGLVYNFNPYKGVNELLFKTEYVNNYMHGKRITYRDGKVFRVEHYTRGSLTARQDISDTIAMIDRLVPANEERQKMKRTLAHSYRERGGC